MYKFNSKKFSKILLIGFYVFCNFYLFFIFEFNMYHIYKNSKIAL